MRMRKVARRMLVSTSLDSASAKASFRIFSWSSCGSWRRNGGPIGFGNIVPCLSFLEDISMRTSLIQAERGGTYIFLCFGCYRLCKFGSLVVVTYRTLNVSRESRADNVICKSKQRSTNSQQHPGGKCGTSQDQSLFESVTMYTLLLCQALVGLATVAPFIVNPIPSRFYSQYPSYTEQRGWFLKLY